jgi:hypothetical protein
MSGPERIWINLNAPWDGMINPVHGTGGLPEYIRRDPAVLAALPEVAALVAEAVARAGEAVDNLRLTTEKTKHGQGYNMAIDDAYDAITELAAAIRAGGKP